MVTDLFDVVLKNRCKWLRELGTTCNRGGSGIREIVKKDRSKGMRQEETKGMGDIVEVLFRWIQ